jgi:hypothetical protein
MSQQGSYSMQQIAFAFSQVVGAGDSVTSNFAQTITQKFDDLTSQFQQYLGSGWSMPWGPAIEQSGAAADNAMIVAAGSDASNNPVYIVAVAGTNPKSHLDGTEDLDVGAVVPFHVNAKINLDAQIDLGTSIGIAILEAMVPGRQTLQQYLESVASPSATLIFTGHSLGGALSPALALDLFVNKHMDLGKWGAVYVTPSAGPTPGNADFSTLFASTFPSTSDGWNLNVVNSLDCVPRAWSDLSSIPTIYEPNLGATSEITALVLAFERLRGSEGQFYAALPAFAFFGTYNPNALPAPPPPPSNEDLTPLQNATALFAAQALYQHIPAYVAQLTPELESFFAPPSLTAADYEKLLARAAVVRAA